MCESVVWYECVCDGAQCIVPAVCYSAQHSVHRVTAVVPAVCYSAQHSVHRVTAVVPAVCYSAQHSVHRVTAVAPAVCYTIALKRGQHPPPTELQWIQYPTQLHCQYPTHS
jgi:phosphoribosylpyrophosphate synthetase